MMSTFNTGRHITSGPLVPVLEAMVDERTPIHALWRKQNHRIPKIRVFIEFLIEIFGAVPIKINRQTKTRQQPCAPVFNHPV